MADILVFAPHPDDAEIGAGGTMARHARLGYEVVVCDLTAGELGTNGTPEERLREAREAAKVIGLAAREVLGLQDRALDPTPERVRAVAEAVRRWRPRLVLAPDGEDRHPDHVAASRLVKEAVFSAGLPRYRCVGEPHRVARVVGYPVNGDFRPDFTVDVTEVYELKRAALACYKSQFAAAAGPPAAAAGPPAAAAGPCAAAAGPCAAGGDSGCGVRPTRLNQGFLAWVELRDTWYGSRAGVARAEGFRWEGILIVGDLVRQL